MKMSAIQHKLANFDFNNDPLNRICLDKMTQTSIIDLKIQLIFNCDSITFNTQTSLDLIA